MVSEEENSVDGFTPHASPITLHSRIRWDCRRGMLELDIVLDRFMAQHFEKLTPLEVEAFKTLLHFPDHDLWGMIQGENMDGDENNQRVLQLLRLC